MERAPVAHPALERAPDAVVGERLGVRHLEMMQQRDRLHGGVALEDRHQHRLPHPGKRIRDGATALGSAPGRQTRFGVDPTGGALGSKPARAAARRWL